MSEPLRQLAVIREQEQTFSLRVETPDVEEPGKFWGQQIKDSVARVGILSSRNESGRFMQHNRKRRLGAKKFAIDFDVVARARLRAEICADLAVDGDTPLRDQLITMSPRTNAGSGEETVEAQEKKLQG